MQHNGLDRRTFLKGAGITAIGAAAMGALTGVAATATPSPPARSR